MNGYIVNTEHLSYSFNRDVPVLTDVDLKVPSNSIYGFLGPNGAGKTTTLRLLTGLLRNQRGEISVFGKNFIKHRIEILKNMGASVEQPSLYQHLTGRENLEISRLIYRCTRKRIEEVLEMVGLVAAGNKKVKQYSLGMKQRLSIAIALLHQPELLVLDEPANGLDPNGIIETRALIIQLNKEFGTTVLVSSHILAEVEKIATHVGIIHKGRMLFQGTLKTLQQMQTGQSTLEIQTSNDESAMALLGNEFSVHKTSDGISMPFRDREQAAMINRRLVEKGVDVYALHPRGLGLEEIFIDLIAEKS